MRRVIGIQFLLCTKLVVQTDHCHVVPVNAGKHGPVADSRRDFHEGRDLEACSDALAPSIEHNPHGMNTVLTLNVKIGSEHDDADDSAGRLLLSNEQRCVHTLRDVSRSTSNALFRWPGPVLLSRRHASKRLDGLSISFAVTADLNVYRRQATWLSEGAAERSSAVAGLRTRQVSPSRPSFWAMGASTLPPTSSSPLY